MRWVVSIYIILRPQIESPKVLSRKIFFFINNISFKTRKIEGTICHKQNEHKHKNKNKIKKVIEWIFFFEQSLVTNLIVANNYNSY